MNKQLFIIFGIFIVVLAGLLIVSRTPVDDEQPIGGERDQYGCLGPAGYTYNESLDVCVREWEVDNDTQRQAVQTVVTALPVDSEGFSYTVVEVLAMRCPGCFMLTMELRGERTKVTLDNWEVVEITDASINGAGDASTEPQGLGSNECVALGGRTVNTVAGDTCEEDEINIGDVVGFISPNICCLSEEAVTQIDSFEKCADAGFPIMESYPMQCRMPDGRTFTQEIVMSEKVARSIAETSQVCTSEGTVGELEVHNIDTATWWFALTPHEPKAGCKPACVVNEVTQETEVNWRCTGVILPE